MQKKDYKKFIYFDNASTTKPMKVALDAFNHSCECYFGNPSSDHSVGKMAKNKLIWAKKEMSDMMSAGKGDIIFVPSATIANNLAILGRVRFLQKVKKDRVIDEKFKRSNLNESEKFLKDENKNAIKVIFSEFDHPSIVEPIKSLDDIEYLTVDLPGLYKYIKPSNEKSIYGSEKGLENYVISQYKNKFENKSADMLILQWVNNENGLILPVLQIAKILKKTFPDIYIHIDATQGLMKLPFKEFMLSMNEDKKSESIFDYIDSFTASAHKFGSVKGAAILWLREIAGIRPLIFGGNQMSGVFPSTENIPAIACMAKTVEYLKGDLETRFKKALEYKNNLYNRIRHDKILFDNLIVLDDLYYNNLELMNDKKWQVENYNKILFSPFIVKIYNKKLPAQVVQNIFNDNNIAVSIGSACSTNKKHVLKDNLYFGVPDNIASNGIRISFFDEFKTEDLDIFLGIFKQMLEKYG
jgi:cysteine desulfurase